jgi:ubiquitin-protein ligase E3 A
VVYCVFLDDRLRRGLLKEKLIDVCTSCHAAGKWLMLSRLIRAAFGDGDALVSNFITPLQKEVVRSMEVDADKDVDDSEEHSDRGSYSGTSAARLSILPDPVVHIDSVRSCFAYLFDIDKHFGLSDLPFVSDLATAVEAMTARLVRGSTTSEASLLVNVIFILMELPMDTVAELSDSVLPCICRMAEHLPVDMQARLVKLWAENCDATRLRDMVHTVQQYITMQVLMTSWSRDVLVNDDPKITSAAKLLKILFYASVLGGRVDTPAVREAEKQHAIESMIVRETLHDLLQRLDDGASASRSR